MLKKVYLYDDAGFYAGTGDAQLNQMSSNEEWIFPPMSTDLVPPLDAEHWCKFENGVWAKVAKPTSAQECLGIVIEHTSATPHDIELRVLMAQLVEKDSGYSLRQRENDHALYVEKKPEPTPEEVAAQELDKAKTERAQKVGSIVVEVDGMLFDGDEASQDRMSRALHAAEITGMTSTEWVLYDNTIATVTKEQLEKAFSQAILLQGELWTKPYE